MRFFFFRSDETWEAGFFSIIDSCLLDFAQVDPPGTMGQHPLQVWLRAVPSPRPRPRPTCASRPLSLCPPLVPRPTALRALPDARVPRGGVPKGGDHDPSAQFARVHAQRHRARPQWRLRRALGRLRCHAASRPSADFSSLTGPSLTGGAAIQSGKFLNFFLEQLGDGGDFYGCCGDDSGDDDEAAAWGRPLAAEAPLERRVARAAPGPVAEHGTGRRGTQQLRREPLGTLGRVLYVLECVCLCVWSLGRPGARCGSTTSIVGLVVHECSLCAWIIIT